LSTVLILNVNILMLLQENKKQNPFCYKSAESLKTASFGYENLPEVVVDILVNVTAGEMPCNCERAEGRGRELGREKSSLAAAREKDDSGASATMIS
jgi:hypothetical protein